jgi:hypothetical protein
MLRCGESQPLYAAMQQKIHGGLIFAECGTLLLSGRLSRR